MPLETLAPLAASSHAGTPDAASLFVHVRILVGMVVGLGLTHLLRNFADLLERPERRRLYWVHLAWALFVLLYLLHFWWWEFRLSHLIDWNFNIYIFITLYALLLYLLCAIIFPGTIGDCADYREYFHSRRHLFFGLLATVYLVDVVDTWIKGPDYFNTLGPEYLASNVVHFVLCVAAIFIRRPGFHATFVLAALVYQLSWIVRQFESL